MKKIYGPSRPKLKLLNVFSGIVVYSGPECRATMNNSVPESKIGLLDIELNSLTKVLFVATVGLSLLMMVLKVRRP